MLLAQAMALPQPHLQNGILLSTRDDTVAAQPAQDQAQNQQAEANVQAAQAQQADSNKQVDQTEATAQNAQADAAKAAAPAADAAQNQPQQNDAAQPGISNLFGSFLGGNGAKGGGSGISIPFLGSSSGMGSGGKPASSPSQSFFGGLSGLVDAASKIKPPDNKPDDSWKKAIEDWEKALQGKKDDDKDAWTKWYEDYQKQWKDYYDKLYGKKDDDDKNPYEDYEKAFKAWKKAYEGGGDDDEGGSIDGNTLKFKIKDLEFSCYWYVPYPGNAQLNCNYYYNYT
ncbi:uncharacterized protein RHO25_005292 [Cercospora beticola]|nr:hypothetical protein RHO25_005292 [Cercospora beticola]